MTYSAYYEELAVAHYWGLDPDTYANLPRAARANMTAFMRSTRLTEAELSKPKRGLKVPR